MVDAGVGDVEAADAVGEDSDALALEAAQDRPRRIGAEGGGRDPRLARQSLADGRPHVAGKLLARHDRSAGQHVLPVAAEAGDDDVLIMVGVGTIGGLRRRGRSVFGGEGGRLVGRVLGEGGVGKQQDGGSSQKR
jgi:hypothetical protein